MITIIGKTDKGKVRHSNQDSFTFRTFSDDCGYAVVCDGMGGANGGETASRLAAESVKRSLDEAVRPNLSERSVRLAFETAIFNANHDVFAASLENPELKGMGTTLALALVLNNTAYIAHIGDSRVYLYSDDKLSCLTRDHSIVQNLVENGQLTPSEALKHPHRNIITRAVGVDEYVNMDFDVLALEDNDILLLCSDGLTNYAGESAIAKILSSQRTEDMPQSLIDEAIKGGGGDNITAVIIKN